MRTMTRMLILCAVMLAALTATAQTTITGTFQGNFSCGRTNYYCFGVPFNFSGVIESAWFDSDFVDWTTDPLGLAGGVGWATVTSSIYTVSVPATRTTPGYSTATGTFSGTTTSGEPYTGSYIRQYKVTYSSGGGGRGGGGAGYQYTITSASITLTIN